METNRRIGMEFVFGFFTFKLKTFDRNMGFQWIYKCYPTDIIISSLGQWVR